MNKLAEQLSNDIAVRAAQKLAALNGQMEKDADISSIVRDVAKGTAQGALNGQMEKDADISSIVRDVAKGTAQGALSALVGTVGGTGIGAVGDSLLNWTDEPSGLEEIGGILGGTTLPLIDMLRAAERRSLPTIIGNGLGSMGANHMLSNLASANFVTLNPGILEEDDEPEEDPKLASYNNMEKAAGIGDIARSFLTSGKARSMFNTRLGQDLGGAVTGAGAGALLGGVGNAARGFMFDSVDPKEDGFFKRIGKGISDFGTGALYGGLAGAAGGAYKAHSNFSDMLDKSKDAIRAAGSGHVNNYKKDIANTIKKTIVDAQSEGLPASKVLQRVNALPKSTAAVQNMKATTDAIKNIRNMTNNQFNGGFQSGFWQGMNSVGDSLLFRNPVGNFLSSYNNNPFMNKKWKTPVPQSQVSAT